MRRLWGIMLVLVLALAAGCSGGGDDDGDTSAADSSASADSAEGSASGAVATTIASLATGGEGEGSQVRYDLPDLPVTGRDIVRRAEIAVEVDEGTFAARFREASMLARSLGGFVESSSTTSFEEGRARGELTLRVPVDRYDDAMDRLSDLGTLVSVDEHGEDVTERLVDLDARLRVLRAEEHALNALLADAGSVDEILRIRDAATGIRQQIEQLAAQQAALGDQAALSTIRVGLHESSAVLAQATPGDDDWSIADAVRTAVDAGEAVVGSAIVVIGVVVPLLPLLALAWWVAIRRRRTVVVTEG